MRADRLLKIIVLLNVHQPRTAQALADDLEVSERTIYRDLDALSGAGVPVYSQPGPNGGIFLDVSYRQALSGLTPDDLQALFLHTAGRPLEDLGIPHALDDLLLKILATLPARQRESVEQMRQRLLVDPTQWFQPPDTKPFWHELQQAVWDDRCIQVVYQTVESRQQSLTLEPYALVAKANVWYLVGRTADTGWKNYRVGRLLELTLLEAQFERAPDFDLAAYWAESCRAFEADMIRRSPLFEVVLDVHEGVFPYFVGYMEGRYTRLEADLPDGWQRLQVRYGAFEEARSNILGFGRYARVVEPTLLRDSVYQMAREVLALA